MEKSKSELLKNEANFSEITVILENIFCDAVVMKFIPIASTTGFVYSRDALFKKREILKKAVELLGWNDINVVRDYVRNILITGVSVIKPEGEGKDNIKFNFYGDNVVDKTIVVKWQRDEYEPASYVEQISRSFNIYKMAVDTILLEKLKSSEEINLEEMKYFENEFYKSTTIPRNRFNLDATIEETESEKRLYKNLINRVQNQLREILLGACEYIRNNSEAYKDYFIAADDIAFVKYDD